MTSHLIKMVPFLEAEGAIRMCGNVCWVVWSFVLGAIPRFFSSEWLGPVVPCPSDVATLVLPLAVTLLSVRPAKRAIRTGLAGGRGTSSYLWAPSLRSSLLWQ